MHVKVIIYETQLNYLIKQDFIKVKSDLSIVFVQNRTYALALRAIKGSKILAFSLNQTLKAALYWQNFVFFVLFGQLLIRGPFLI